MADLYATIYTALSALGYPVREQGGYAGVDQLPATHITYQVIAQPNNAHADNRPTSTTSTVQVTLYSRDPAIAQAADATLKGVLLPAGFLRAGGRQLPIDPDTGHRGYASDYRFFESEV